MDLAEMKRIKEKQNRCMQDMDSARIAFNNAIDEFDAIVRGCEYYRPAICHGENDPECDHPDIEVKWCEAEHCPLLK